MSLRHPLATLQIAAVAAIFILSPAMALAAPKASRVTLTLSGMKDREGALAGGLYNNAADFPTEGKAQMSFRIPISKLTCRQVTRGGEATPTCIVTLPRVPAGRWAVAVAHDRNADGKIERSPFSSERKGMSNYTSKLLSMPSFDKAAVTIKAPATRLAIELH